MDVKNNEALSYGREWMLARFANLRTDSASTDVKKFYETYGDLYPGWGADDTARKFFAYYVGGFRFAWGAKSRADKEIVSKFITRIFEREIAAEKLELLRASPFDDPEDPESRAAIVADFESGEVTVKPRTLLDWLAKGLLDCRDQLAICHWKNCETPYYVKKHPRYKYCSPSCAIGARQTRKNRWWRDNRGKNERRRFLKLGQKRRAKKA